MRSYLIQITKDNDQKTSLFKERVDLQPGFNNKDMIIQILSSLWPEKLQPGRYYATAYDTNDLVGYCYEITVDSKKFTIVEAYNLDKSKKNDLFKCSL